MQAAYRLSCLFAIFAVAAAVSACSGSQGIDFDGASGSNSTGASSSLGLVMNAPANFLAADGVTLLGTGNTGATGVVTLNVGGYSGPVIIEVLGDPAATYYDEAAMTGVPFPPGNSLHAIVPSPSGTVGVTILTELAYRAALQNGLFPITASAVNQLNTIVGAALAPGLSSILSVPTVFDSGTTSGSLADNEAGRYALILAALAQLGASGAAPALDVMNALIEDLMDGVIDSQDDGSPITTPYTDFINEMIAALNSQAAAYGDSDLQANASNQAPASTTVDSSGVSNGGGDTGGGTPNGDTTPATVHADLVGSYNLVYSQNAAGGPFAEGQMVTATVGSNSTLMINGKTLTNPFNRAYGGPPNSFELIWWDEEDNIEYALSDNQNGSFNEINVGDASNAQANGIPGFLGQLKEDIGGGSGPTNLELVTALAGNYSITATNSGSHSRGTLSINDDGDIDFDTGASFTQADIDVIYDRLSCCNRVGVQMNQMDGQSGEQRPEINLYVDGSNNLIRAEYFPNGLVGPGTTVDVDVTPAS